MQTGLLLLGDNGFGAAAVAELAREFQIPPGLQVADGGTLGLALLRLVAESQHVILVDAIREDAPAGSFARIDGDGVAPAVHETRALGYELVERTNAGGRGGHAHRPARGLGL